MQHGINKLFEIFELPQLALHSSAAQDANIVITLPKEVYDSFYIISPTITLTTMYGTRTIIRGD